ncbi:hypothetical protein C2S52_015532 [Perilla frutescens var. hirtella]|nr:hypothetical protein C2S52_015532 [Perilla frutescens var. hirtella]
MEDSQQDMKRKASYEQWTKEQSDVLLELMVDAVGWGWRDNSGIFSKTTVEERILPVLNEKLGSGFEYDPTTKKFTASDEVWDAYLEAHSKDTHLRYGECHDYDDLEITVGNGVAVGKNSIGLGSATDAKTLGDDENRDARIEDLTFDPENEVFLALSQDEPPSSGSTPPSRLPEVSEGSTQRRNQPKSSRAHMENLEILEEEIDEEEMEEEMDEEEEMELYEDVRLLMLAIKAVIVLLGKITMMPRRIEHSLQRRPITRNGCHFVQNMIEGDPQSFRQLYKMYPDAFMKLCSIIREKTHLEDTRYIWVYNYRI